MLNLASGVLGITIAVGVTLLAKEMDINTVSFFLAAYVNMVLGWLFGRLDYKELLVKKLKEGKLTKLPK